MAKNNHNWGTYDLNEIKKLVKYHQKTETVLVRTCMQTIWKNTSTNCTKPSDLTNNNMMKLRDGQKKTWITNLEKDLDDLRLHLLENLTVKIDLFGGNGASKRCTDSCTWSNGATDDERQRQKKGVKQNVSSAYSIIIKSIGPMDVCA